MDWIEVLKWVGLVLAAGFVGYFGRYLAMWIIDKFRGGKTSKPPSTSDPISQNSEQSLKIEKKRAKAEVKSAKKTGKK